MAYSQKTIDYIKEKHPNIDEEQIKLILNSFYQGLKHYCTNPFDAKTNILVNGLMKLWINERKVDRYLERIELLKPNTKFNKKALDAELYHKLKKTIQKYERQKTEKFFD